MRPELEELYAQLPKPLEAIRTSEDLQIALEVRDRLREAIAAWKAECDPEIRDKHAAHRSLTERRDELAVAIANSISELDYRILGYWRTTNASRLAAAKQRQSALRMSAREERLREVDALHAKGEHAAADTLAAEPFARADLNYAPLDLGSYIVRERSRAIVQDSAKFIRWAVKHKRFDLITVDDRAVAADKGLIHAGPPGVTVCTEETLARKSRQPDA